MKSEIASSPPLQKKSSSVVQLLVRAGICGFILVAAPTALTNWRSIGAVAVGSLFAILSYYSYCGVSQIFLLQKERNFIRTTILLQVKFALLVLYFMISPPERRALDVLFMVGAATITLLLTPFFLSQSRNTDVS